MTTPRDQHASLRNAIRNVRRFLRKHLPDTDTAEDVLQEVLLKSVTASPDSEIRNPSAWTRRIARNAITDFYRARAARLRREDRYAAETEALARTEEADVPSPCRCVTSILPALKPEYAAALGAVDRDGRAPSDVAREQGISRDNLAVRLHRARAALRTRLRQNCGECAERGCVDCDCRVPNSPGSPERGSGSGDFRTCCGQV